MHPLTRLNTKTCWCAVVDRACMHSHYSPTPRKKSPTGNARCCPSSWTMLRSTSTMRSLPTTTCCTTLNATRFTLSSSLPRPPTARCQNPVIQPMSTHTKMCMMSSLSRLGAALSWCSCAMLVATTATTNGQPQRARATALNQEVAQQDGMVCCAMTPL